MIDLSGLQRWANDPAGPIGQDVQRRAKRVVARGKQLAPVDQGLLRSRIHAEPPHRTAVGIAVDVVCDVNYARAVHDGRRAGRTAPPSAALAGWARRHGAPGAQFVIARAIGRRGIPARPFLRDALLVAVR